MGIKPRPSRTNSREKPCRRTWRWVTWEGNNRAVQVWPGARKPAFTRKPSRIRGEGNPASICLREWVALFGFEPPVNEPIAVNFSARLARPTRKEIIDDGANMSEFDCAHCGNKWVGVSSDRGEEKFSLVIYHSRCPVCGRDDLIREVFPDGGILQSFKRSSMGK